ncbi:GumC family protein [Kamptonema formosum]|uniref:GumC family protein n=1 Tax=Kamptonema formosum TaxID=331992 RepID=UPI001E41649B|nr:tyrosine-protein kinase family protein [Oscillatoria sp. PCC 10802]
MISSSPAENLKMDSREALDIDFGHIWLILKRRWLPAGAVFASAVALSSLMAFLQKPVYRAEGKLLFKRDYTTSLTGVGKELSEVKPPLTDKSNLLQTESEVIRSIPLLRETASALNLKDERGAPIDAEEIVKTRLDVKSLPGADVLLISYQGRAPEESAAVVNKLMSIYIENNIQVNRTQVAAAREFISQQLPKAEAIVLQAERALREFKEQNRVVALEEEAKSAVGVITGLENQIIRTQAELADATARSAELRNKLGQDSQEALAVSSLNQSAGVREVLQELQQVEAQLAVDRTRFQEAHPAIAGLKEKRAALKAVLQERVAESLGSPKPVSEGDLQIGETKENLAEELVKSEVERFGLAGQVERLSQTLASYKERVNILPKLEQDQRQLQRKLEAAQSTYEMLLKNLEEVRLAETQNIGNARILEPAPVPEKPLFRKPAILFALGSLLGVLLSTATVVILEIRDTSIKTLKEVKDVFGYILLGTIPYFGKKALPRGKDKEWPVPNIPVRDTPHSPISEAYRMLQANLKFLSSDKPLKVIVVTSSVAKEGKSAVSANLAAAVAQLGRRVLLVDADMRHPLQHHIWELINAVGLSNAIVGQADFKTAATEVMPNLDVLTAGVVPPNPLALLDSKRMASLIEYFSENYDFVIVDAPPLVIAADALTLGKMADGVLLVVRPEVVDYNSAAAAKEYLQRSGQNVLGLVANALIVENESDSYFYYGTEYAAQKVSTAQSGNYASRH